MNVTMFIFYTCTNMQVDINMLTKEWCGFSFSLQDWQPDEWLLGEESEMKTTQVISS